MSAPPPVDIRVRLLGALQAQAEADRVARASRSMVSSVRRMAGGLAGPLRQVGEASRYAGMAVAGFSVAAAGYLAKAGADYNQTLDRQRIAFTTFMGSAKKAQAFIGQLQKLAESSPVLDLKTTGGAAQSLMAYGLAVKDILPMVKALGDMSAASGQAITEVMPRAAMAIGQIQSKGKLQAEEMNQLAESVKLGRGDIRKALRMTTKDFEDAFKGGNKFISADQALPAIRKALEAKAKGAAEALAQTTEGRIDRLKEVLAKGMGTLTRGMYDAVGKQAGSIADSLAKVDMKKVSGGIGSSVQKGIGLAKEAFAAFMDVVRPAEPFWKNVLGPLVSGIAKGIGGSVALAFAAVVPIAKTFFKVLGWLGEKAAPLKGIFGGVGKIIGFLFAGPILKAIGLIGKLGGVFRLVGGAAKLLGAPIGFVAGVFKTLAYPVAHLFKSVGFLVDVFKVLLWPTKAVYTLFKGLFSWIGSRLPQAGQLATAFQGIGQAIRVMTWPLRQAYNGIRLLWNAAASVPGRFRTMVASVKNLLTNGLLNTVASLPRRFQEFGLKAATALVSGIKKIPSLIGTAFSKGLGFAADIGRSMANWMNANTPLGDKVDLPSPLPDFTLPALAHGGIATNAGAVLVGERGPELLSLQKGARVDPLPKRGPLAGTAASALGDRPIVTQVYLDRRQIAEAIGRDTRDRLNRR